MKANHKRINGALLYATRHNHSTVIWRVRQAINASMTPIGAQASRLLCRADEQLQAGTLALQSC